MASHWRSHGILIAMIGIVVTISGIVTAAILPARGLGGYAPLLTGVLCFAGGAVLVLRENRRRGERVDPQLERHLPRARVVRGPRR